MTNGWGVVARYGGTVVTRGTPTQARDPGVHTVYDIVRLAEHWTRYLKPSYKFLISCCPSGKLLQLGNLLGQGTQLCSVGLHLFLKYSPAIC